MNKPVCIDSHLIIWGIKKEASKGQEHMIEKAENFFKYMDSERIEIILPSIVVAVILSPETAEKRTEYLRVLTKSFRICDFDLLSAKKYAELLHVKLPDIKEYRTNNSIRNDKMKFDYAIVATAIVNNASCIYSYDPHLSKFANGIIEIKEIPPIPKQSVIDFEQEEISGVRITDKDFDDF